jgi:hypothetical protein
MDLVGQYRCHVGGGPAVDRAVVLTGVQTVPDYLMFVDDPGVAWTRVDRPAGMVPEFVAAPLVFGDLFDVFVSAVVDRVLGGDGGRMLQVSGWDPGLVTCLIRSDLHDEVLKGLLVAMPIEVGF